MRDKRSIWDAMGNLNEFIIAFAFAIVAAIILDLFHNPFSAPLLLSISLLAITGIGIYNIYHKNIEALNGLYSFIGKSSSLKPVDMLEAHPYKTYYHKRDEDDLIDKCLNDKNNVLIIGSPLAGKTRALFQALNKLKEPQKIAIPKCKDINPETFELPKNTKIIVIDNLHSFVEQRNFDDLFRIAIKSNIVIAATCQSAEEYQRVINKMLERNIPLEGIFKNIIELPKVSEYDAREIAKNVGINWDDVVFDGTVGSIFMCSGEMKIRFDNCNPIEKTILRIIKTLHICGIYKENLIPLEWIKIAANEVELEGRDYEWTDWLENLEGKGFITLEENGVRADEYYLEDVVKLPAEIKNLDVLKKKLTDYVHKNGKKTPDDILDEARELFKDGGLIPG